MREISGQAVATSLLERLNGQLVRHQFQLSLRPGRPQASLPEHLAIFERYTGAPEARDVDVCRSALESHEGAKGGAGVRQDPDDTLAGDEA